MALTKTSTDGIKDDAISLDKLAHGTSSQDGKFLRANNGAAPSFETVSSVGGATGVDFNDSVKARFGTGNDLEIYHDGSNSYIDENGTGDLKIRTYNGNGIQLISGSSENMITCDTDGAVGLYYDNTKHFETQTNGVKIDSAGDTVLELHTSNAGAHNRINFSVDSGDNYGGIWYSAGYNRMEFRTNNAERATIDSSGDLRVGRIYSNTTSGGANVRVQSDGLMQRDTSSRRYKNTIADATHGLADLNKLRPVTYKGNNDGDTVFGGLIAEEVHDAGLTEFVDYDSDNQPDALKYGNMVSLCIKAIQELSAKVETLETKVAALEAA